MIKSAVIFGAGFVCGVAYTSSRLEAVERAAYAFVHFLQDESLKDDVERKKKADEAAGAEPQPRATDQPDEAEVVDDAASQGETPS